MADTKQTEQPKTPGYMASLVAHLESNGVKNKVIELIKDFSAEFYLAQEDPDPDIVNFGKYKGKKFVDILKLDRNYIRWLNKNNNYLKEPSKKIVAELLL